MIHKISTLRSGKVLVSIWLHPDELQFFILQITIRVTESINTIWSSSTVQLALPGISGRASLADEELQIVLIDSVTQIVICNMKNCKSSGCNHIDTSTFPLRKVDILCIMWGNPRETS